MTPVSGRVTHFSAFVIGSTLLRVGEPAVRVMPGGNLTAPNHHGMLSVLSQPSRMALTQVPENQVYAGTSRPRLTRAEPLFTAFISDLN